MSDSSPSHFEAELKVSGDQTEVSWTSPIMEFVLERKSIVSDGSSRWEKIGCVPSDQTEFPMESSSEISKYEYRVVAKMNGISLQSQPADRLSLGEMVESGEKTSETPVKSPTESLLQELFESASTLPTAIPSAPSIPTITQRISDNAIVILWNPPTNDGCFPITSYIVERSNKDHTAWTPIDRFPGNETSATIDWKISEPALRIIAENALGRSEPSEYLVIRQLMPAAPKVEIDTSNSKYIELKWSVPSRDSLQYSDAICFHIWKHVGSESSSKFVKVAMNRTANSYRDTNVMRGQGYRYQVYSVSANGEMNDTLTEWVKFEPMQEAAIGQSMAKKQSKSADLVMAPKLKPSSESKQAKEKPLGPINVPSPLEGPPTIQRVTEQSIIIWWKPPMNNGGSLITSYIIECSTSTTDESWSPIKHVSSSFTSASLNLMDPYQAFRIIVENIAGRSEPSQSASIRQLRPPPPHVKVETHPNFLKIIWTVPEHPFPQYAKAETFRIRKTYRETDDGQCKLAKMAWDLTHFSYRDFRVVPGESYQYEVTAVSVTGQMERSKTEWVKFDPMQSKKKEKRTTNEARKGVSRSKKTKDVEVQD